MQKSLASFFTILCLGCASTSKYTGKPFSIHEEDNLRARAGFDFNCPPEQLVVTEFGPNKAGVSGCEKSGTYDFVGMSGWVPSAENVPAR